METPPDDRHLTNHDELISFLNTKYDSAKDRGGKQGTSAGVDAAKHIRISSSSHTASKFYLQLSEASAFHKAPSHRNWRHSDS
jgi:hypothetical protein